MRSFLGLCSVYRRPVKNSGPIADPLTKRLRKSKDPSFRSLNDVEMESFETLKSRLTSPQVISLSKARLEYIVETEAYNVQVGCVLQRKHPDGTIRPLGYFSRKSIPSGRNYDTTQRECLGIVWAVLLLQPYLYGACFTLRTDHNALKWIMDMTAATGMLDRWRLRLLELEFDMVHRLVRNQQAPGALSRLLTAGADTTDLHEEVPVFSVTGNDDEEEECPINATNLRILCKDDRNPLSPSKRENPGDEQIKTDVFLAEQAKEDECQGFENTIGFSGSRLEKDSKGLLWRTSKIDNARQLVVPSSLRKRVLYLSHDPLLQGTPERQKCTTHCQFDAGSTGP